MKNLNHPNVVQLIESGKANYKTADGETQVDYIAVKHAANGELFDFISQSGTFSEPVARFFFR